MIRTRHILAALALGLFALPAAAQGTVRERRGVPQAPAPAPTPGERDHRTPKPPSPAPTPSVRDHRTAYDPATHATDMNFPPGEMRQWLIRGASSVNPGQEYTIINLRRQFLGETSRLKYLHYDSAVSDTVDWGDDGGNWIFTRSNMNASGPLKSNEAVALYNTKTRRYLVMAGYVSPIWKDKPQYVWRVEYTQAAADGARFALHSLPEKRFVVLCHLSLKDKSQDLPRQDDALCAVRTPATWQP